MMTERWSSMRYFRTERNK